MIRKHKTDGSKPQDVNPMEVCCCGKYIGHRGFCSKKCHDKVYDEVINKRDIVTDLIADWCQRCGLRDGSKVLTEDDLYDLDGSIHALLKDATQYGIEEGRKEVLEAFDFHKIKKEKGIPPRTKVRGILPTKL